MNRVYCELNTKCEVCHNYDGGLKKKRDPNQR